MSFINRLFPTDISYGSGGGPRFRTEMVTTATGFKHRTSKWAQPLAVFDVGYGIKTTEQMQVLQDFYYEMRGAFHTFKFKNWNDYTQTDHPLVPTGAATLQLAIQRGAGFDYHYKKITKPATNITFELNGSSYGATVNLTTGVISLISTNTKFITAVTQANPAVVTTNIAHGYANGDIVEIVGVVGMTELNGNLYTVAGATSTTFQLSGIDSTGYTAYSSAGTINKYPQPPKAAKSITAINNASPIQVTTAGTHGYATGDYVRIDSPAGMAGLGGKVYQITVTGASTFTLDGVDGTSLGLYEGGGSAVKYGDYLTFTGDYYYHVSFRSDELDLDNVSYDTISTAIEIIEERD